MILNLLGLATVILAVGLIFIGKWVQKEALNIAATAQVVAMICVITAAFMLM